MSGSYLHKNTDGAPTFTNRLSKESSPYLRQHAHNPVQWFAWGEEAFQKAKEENRPIFLSIGYSTCHWCHVMARESFEDLEIAEVLNREYVPIKLDREERPDIDSVYMSVTQMLTGQGGWPMSVWLTPSLEPFYAGTYFPPREGDRGARIGFLSILHRLSELYRERPDQVREQASAVVAELSAHSKFADSDRLPGTAVMGQAYRMFASQYDSEFGGFGSAPKFPRPAALEFLMRYGRRSGVGQATDMALHTLEKMARGGMYDQIGGGFHRYSVDGQWLVPHFEKMLYDNAQLALAYLSATQISSEDGFRRVATETLDYIRREMTDPAGGFWSATDADSEGEEGKFFVWTREELMNVVGSENGEIVADAFGVTSAGNFEGTNVLYLPKALDEDVRRVVEAVRGKLYEVRQRRIPPETDRKIVTSWNGLMIAAFARGAWVLNDASYLERGEMAAQFLLMEHRKGKSLLRSSCDGRKGSEGFLDDYVFLAFGLLELFEASGKALWLDEAIRLMRVVTEEYSDPLEGGLFFTGTSQPRLLVREKPFYDGAEPSGNAVAALNFFRLESLTGDAKYGEMGRGVLRFLASIMERQPTVVPFALSAMDYATDRPKEILWVGSRADDFNGPFWSALRDTYLPNRVIVPPSRDGRAAEAVVWAKGKTEVESRPTAYLCERGICGLPTTDEVEFRNRLREVTPYELG